MTIAAEEEDDCLTKLGVIAMRLRAMDFDGDDCIDLQTLCEELREVANTTPEQLAALDRIEQAGQTGGDWPPRVATAVEAYCTMRLLAKTTKRLESDAATYGRI